MNDSSYSRSSVSYINTLHTPYNLTLSFDTLTLTGHLSREPSIQAALIERPFPYVPRRCMWVLFYFLGISSMSSVPSPTRNSKTVPQERSVRIIHHGAYIKSSKSSAELHAANVKERATKARALCRSLTPRCHLLACPACLPCV